ncbi:MAG: hypothetical protein KDC74_09310, partial [Flavobacteriaceae bacterium]|nr:hypothetical protein [Flavobacteriaceae bacterium]
MKRSIYIIISLLFFNTCFSQDYNNLYQKWYLTESYDCLNDSIIKESKWNLNIKSNKNLIIFFNNEKLNKEVSYSLSDSILIFNKINFQI